MRADPRGILEQMGIDVWRLREPAAQDSAAPKPAAGDRPAPADSRVAVAARPAEAGRGLVAEPGAEELEASEPSVLPVPAAVERPLPVSPFSVLCLLREGAVLIIEPEDLKAGRRFGADLLASVMEVWGGNTQQLIFDWPQRGLENSERALEKALGAFVDRQIDENSGGWILIGAEVLERLGRSAVAGNSLILPPINELMTSGEMKRALWQEIRRRWNS